MSIVTTAEVLETALWPQGDIRDPLGIWGARVGVTGDATGGGIKVTVFVPAARRSAYMYTCYSMHLLQLSGALGGVATTGRLLTNWPNIDSQAGVQAYSTFGVVAMSGSGNFTAPQSGQPIDFMDRQGYRFILLFDPRQSGGDMDIIEMQLGENVNLATYVVEAYGYFWDRSVLNAPGGPRHPGAS